MHKRVLVALGLASVLSISAVGAQGAEVTPDAWAYQALQTLVKHGAITDTEGLALTGESHSRAELTPLIAHAVEKREVMNENDKQLVLRLYDEYRRDLLNYNVAQEDARKEAKLKAQAEKEGTVIDVMDTPLGPEEKALTEEQIRQKMENFKVDTSALAAPRDVVFQLKPQGKNGRQRLEISMSPLLVHGVVAPVGLVPIENPLEERPLTPAELRALEKERRAALTARAQEEKRLAKERVAKEKAERKAQLAAQKRAEKERIALEKQAKKEQLAREKAKKRVRLEAEKKAKQERLTAEKDAKAAAKTASKE